MPTGNQDPGPRRERRHHRGRRAAASVCLLALVGGCSTGADPTAGRAGGGATGRARMGTVLAAPPAAPPSAPGVTLREVDGGPDYFARWANSFPADPGFFPIAVWAETLDDPTWIGRYRRLGVNTFSHLWNGATDRAMDQVRAADMFAVAAVPPGTDMARFDAAYGSHLAAHYYQDEGDGRGVCGDQDERLARLCRPGADGRTDPAALADMADALRTDDPTRPVYGQFTKPVALGQGLDDAQRRAYVDGVDIVSYDWYVLTDPDHPGPVWEQADATRTVRGLTDRTKPVWPFIETSHVFEDSTHRPTPAEVTAETWNAIIGGARGIQYFNHSFKAGLDTQRVLLDDRYRDVAAAVTMTNRRIRDLAPVLNAPEAQGLARVATGRANLLAKAYDGSWFLFVAPRSADAQDVTIRLAGLGDTTATVLYEDRELPVTGGRLTDHFDGADTVHIYRITPPG